MNGRKLTRAFLIRSRHHVTTRSKHGPGTLQLPVPRAWRLEHDVPILEKPNQSDLITCPVLKCPVDGLEVFTCLTILEAKRDNYNISHFTLSIVTLGAIQQRGRFCPIGIA